MIQLSLGRKLVRWCAIYLVITIVLFLIVTFPRTIYMEQMDGVMHLSDGFSLTAYYEQVRGYLTYIVENKTLGYTRNGSTVERSAFYLFMYSFPVVLLSLFLTYTLGFLKGILDYQIRHSRWNLFRKKLTNALEAIPDFFLIICVQYLLIRYLPFIPIFENQEWYRFILPALIVSIYPTVYFAKVTRGIIANEEGSPYLQVAAAKGFNQTYILYKHMVRKVSGSLLDQLPTVTMIVLSNLLIVEFIFSYNGAALRLFRAMDVSSSVSAGQMNQFEPGMILALGLGFMLILFVVQLLAETIKSFVDPRRFE